MSSALIVLTMVVLSLTLVGASPGAQTHDAHLGDVHFPTSCNADAQRHVDRGMQYQHSFWYRESKAAFDAALTADPSCAIAYWGIALSLMTNPFNPTPPRNLAAGLAAVGLGGQLRAGTALERDLIAAVATFYTGADRLDQRTRTRAYAAAMAEVAARYPNDDEVQIAYALALDMSASPTDKTYVNQLKAAAILEPIVQRRPSHPGAAHYLIHSYDVPALAPRGLAAAERYARVAEAAPHAQHMPSHIFTRVGRWEASITANSAAARLARANREPDDELHASDYLVYALLQQGQDRAAREVLTDMSAVKDANPDRNTGPFALAASAARYAMERGDWASAADLAVRPSKFPYVDAITHFARAVGAARDGHPQAAAPDLATLTRLRDSLRSTNDAYWSEQVDIQLRGASAWVRLAEGAADEALATIRAAAEAEAGTEKNVVTPGPLAPARELYAEMLLACGRAPEALASFETTLDREPNRYRALSGAASAAVAAGDAAMARQYYQRLVALTTSADSDRAEVAAAKQFLAPR
jgi:tetratricopeptide (TPR) repeat protein